MSVSWVASVAAKVLHTNIRSCTFLTVSVVHGAEGLVLLQLDNARDIVGLQSFAQDRGVSQRIDLSTFDCLISTDSNLSIAEHLSISSGSPWI